MAHGRIPAHRSIVPLEPGADYLDDSIERLKAAKTALALILARALTSIGSRFLVLGSAIASVDARLIEVEKRDHISWPALDERLEALERMQRENDGILTNALRREQDRETRLGDLETRLRDWPNQAERLLQIESHNRGNMASLQAFAARVAKLEQRADDAEGDAMIRAGLQRLAGRAAEAKMLRAAADLIEPVRLPAPPTKPGDGTA